MAKTIVGLYDDLVIARRVVQQLVNNHFDLDDIGLIAGDAEGEYSRGLEEYRTREATAVDDTGDDVAEGAGIGALLGGTAGLLIGLGALAIPGVGPVVAAGPLIAALTGAGLGAAAGGLIGALAGAGVPEEEARYYAEGVRRGGVLVTVKTADDRADRAAEIMRSFDPIDIQQRAAEWRREGWTDFRDDAPAFTAEERERERARRSRRRETGMPMVDFDTLRPGFEGHYRRHYAHAGRDFEAYYLPAYRYGYTLGTDTRYRDRDWDNMTTVAQQEWNLTRGPSGTWEDVKDAIREGWNRARNRVETALDL